nr:hypothetical protein CFP56_65011 [Quercus suber]
MVRLEHREKTLEEWSLIIEVDCEAIAPGEARFLRVRVDVPLDKPIRGGAPVLSPEGDKVWVAFKYERLCGLCFHCGLLGHEAKACKFTKLKVWEESPYGEWLRATEDVSPQTSDSQRIAGAETEPLQNFNWGHGHSYHSRTIIPDINEEQYWESNDGKNPEINAIPAHQNYMLGKSLKWLKQKLDCFDPKLLLSQGIRWLCDAFQLLLTDPTVKSLVVSLAFDKTVRDVILRNTSVQEFQWIHYAVNYVRPLISNEEPGLATRILMWIWDGAKAIFELTEKFLSQVKGLFQPPKSNNPTEGNKEQMEEKIRSSLPPSVVILLIEVVARALPARITIA